MKRVGPGGVAARLFILAQALVAARVVRRLVTGAGGQRIRAAERPDPDEGATTVILPVLDERRRVGACLDGLSAQGAEVGEILVVDGGSTDGTSELVLGYGARDGRVRLIDAAPVPRDWNGKAWGLQVGLEQTSPRAVWVMTVDADVRPEPPLARSLAAHARRTGLAALSVATLQRLSGWPEGLVHPAMLATLVYRFGPPGRVFRKVGQVQANGQCSLFRRDVLERCGGFSAARASRCEDVTIARHLVANGHRVGFYETDGLVSVTMYEGWRDAWRNWPRSLPLRDQYVRGGSIVGLLEVTLVQTLPLPLAALCWSSGRRRSWAFALNAALAAVRLGVLLGTARAYVRRPWSYWLSPLCDLPVVAALWLSLARRRHVWRGRTLVEGGVA